MALTLPYPNMDFTPLDILTADEMDQLVANIEYIASQLPTKLPAPSTTVIQSIGTINSNSSITPTEDGFLVGKAVVLRNGGSAYILLGTYHLAGVPYFESSASNPNVQIDFCIPVKKGVSYTVAVSTNARIEQLNILGINWS